MPRGLNAEPQLLGLATMRLGLAPLVATARALILLGPPASHYATTMTCAARCTISRGTFRDAASATREPLYAIADAEGRRELTGGVDEAIDGVLDDIWMRDFFVFQLADDVLARFAFDPAYLSAEDVRYIEHRAATVAADVFGDDALVQLARRARRRRARVGARDEARGRHRARAPRQPAGPRRQGARRARRRGRPALGDISLDPYAARPLSPTPTSRPAPRSARCSPTRSASTRSRAIVPEEPGAPTLGHVDGVANWLAPSTLALSNFSNATFYALCEARVRAAFGDAVAVVPFPYEPTDAAWADGFASAEGVYVNFARTQSAIYVPAFGGPADARALAIAVAHGDAPPVLAAAASVAIMGGSGRCLSTYVWGDFAEAAAARVTKSNEVSAASRALSRAGLGALALIAASAAVWS